MFRQLVAKGSAAKAVTHTTGLDLAELERSSRAPGLAKNWPLFSFSFHRANTSMSRRPAPCLTHFNRDHRPL